MIRFHTIIAFQVRIQNSPRTGAHNESGKQSYNIPRPLKELIDVTRTTGKKAEYHSIPYRSISHFSVETAGTFDMDAEMKIYISGNMNPIQREFRRGADLTSVQKTLAHFILHE